MIEAQPIGDDRIEGDAVIDRVEHLDDLLVDLDRVRDDHLSLKQRHEDLSDGGLAVARRTEEEDRLAAVERGSDLRERVLRDHQVRERALELFLGDVDVRDRLRLDAGDVHRQRHRRAPDVLTAGQRFLRLLRSTVDYDVLIARRGNTRATADLHQAFGLEEIEHPFDDVRERQAKRGRDLVAAHLSTEVQRLEREIGEEPER